MHPPSTRPSVPSYNAADIRLWLAAVLAFGVGDFVTTSVGLSIGGIEERSPLVAMLLEQYGWTAMLGVKAVAFTVSYTLWMVLPRPQRLGIPMGLAFLGTGVTGWNVAVVLTALA